jgi:hypothetical protein
MKKLFRPKTINQSSKFPPGSTHFAHSQCPPGHFRQGSHSQSRCQTTEGSESSENKKIERVRREEPTVEAITEPFERPELFSPVTLVRATEGRKKRHWKEEHLPSSRSHRLEKKSTKTGKERGDKFCSCYVHTYIHTVSQSVSQSVSQTEKFREKKSTNDSFNNEESPPKSSRKKAHSSG